uniref:HTH CENPB-type domain-containing protein n=1 Tax=Crocodylus porosus TaxID=8502 RepID=A0A7M4EMG0_CROPO
MRGSLLQFPFEAYNIRYCQRCNIRPVGPFAYFNMIIFLFLFKEKADDIPLKLGINLQHSNGWLQRFQYHHIISLHVHGKASSTDVLPILDKYSPKDMFNADEKGVFL